MTEPIQPRTLRSVTIEIPGEVIEDVDGTPLAVGDARKFSGTLSHHWDELIAEQGAE